MKLRYIYIIVGSVGCGLLIPKGMYLEAGAASLILSVIVNCLVDIKEAIEENK
jgi:hypothetical protein